MPQDLPRHKSVLAHVGLFYAAAIWGATFFIVKDALSAVDPVTLVAYRFLIAGGLLYLYLGLRGRPILRHWRAGLTLGIMLWFLYVPQTMGLKYTTASNSGFITGLFVAFVPLFLRTIFKRTPTVMEVIASAVSLSGLWILTGGLRDINLGDMLTLITAVSYAIHLLYVDKYLREGADPYIVSAQQFLVVGVLSVAAAAVTGRSFAVETTAAWGIIWFLAIFPTLLALSIQVIAQRLISPLRVSLVFALEPVFAGVFSWTLGGEAFVVHRALGGLLIFFALILSGLPTPRIFRRSRPERA